MAWALRLRNTLIPLDEKCLWGQPHRPNVSRTTIMKNALVFAALLAGVMFSTHETAAAHGGTYRGPGDTVPPGGGGGGGGGVGAPVTGAPAPSGPVGPSVPGATTPGAPPGSPTGSPRPVTTPGSSDAELTAWQFWWGFNKDPYLALKSKIRACTVQTGSVEDFLGGGQARDRRQPTAGKITSIVVPALREALRTEHDNDIVTGCMLALAKIGDTRSEAGASEFEALFAGFLDDSTQEIAETAALALGILGHPSSIDTLVALMQDADFGAVDPHALVGSTEVPMRTRAFAAYGLGLIGAYATEEPVREQIATQLMKMLDAPELSTRDVKVAAMISFGLTRLDVAAPDAPGAPGEVASPSRQAQITFLLDYFDPAKLRAHKEARHSFTLAHAPTAMARLLEDSTENGGVDPVLAACGMKEQVVKALLDAVGEHSGREDLIQQSSTLALGQIGDCDNGTGEAAVDGVDISIRKALLGIVRSGEQQSRRFALISLARSASHPGQGLENWGGLREVTAELYEQMQRGQSGLRPWAAIALGVLGRELADRGRAHDGAVDDALLSACEREKDPAQVGAYCLALGLRKHVEAIPVLIHHMREGFRSQDDARGEAAIALGLIGDVSSIEAIEAVIEESLYRPELLKQAAVALGLLGDRQIVGKLVAMLATAKGFSSQAALATALGVIGDSTSIDPLIALLRDGAATAGARGFAAVALGMVCDPEDLPRISRIAVDTNYRANTPTLTGAGTGILDIL